MKPFFMPTEELTDKLIVVQYATDKNLHVGGRHVLSKLRRLLAPTLTTLDKTLRTQTAQEAGLVKRAQADISEQLYHYLVTLGQSSVARRGEPYIFTKVIPEGMKERLGIPFNHWSLLLELAGEFRDWLEGKENGGNYKAPWGRLRLSGDNLWVEVTSEDVQLPKVEAARSAAPDELETLQEASAAAAPPRRVLARGAARGAQENARRYMGAAAGSRRPRAAQERQDDVRAKEERPLSVAETR